MPHVTKQSANRALNTSTRASTSTSTRASASTSAREMASLPRSHSPRPYAADAEEAYYNNIAFHTTSSSVARKGIPPPQHQQSRQQYQQQQQHQQQQPPRSSSFFGKLSLPNPSSHQSLSPGGGSYGGSGGGGGYEGNIAVAMGGVELHSSSLDLGSLSNRYTQLLKQQHRTSVQLPKPSQQSRAINRQLQHQPPLPQHRTSTASSGGFSARLSR